MNRIPLNAPNVLTLLRLALVPVVAVLGYFDYMIPALAVYLLACGTDLLDGYLARKYKLITDAGILLDPLADKLMAIFTVMAFMVTGVLPWPILVVMLVKEGLMIGGGILLYSHGVVAPANTFGKIAAFTLNTSIAFTFLHHVVQPRPDMIPWHIYFVYFGLALMVLALFQYAYFNAYLQLKGKKQTEKKD